VLVVGGVVIPVVTLVGLLVAVLIVPVVIPIMVFVVVLVGVVDVVVPVGFPRGLLVVVVVVREAGGSAIGLVRESPVGDVLVDGMPDNEVTVGGDPSVVDIDIMVELLAELRARRQLANGVRRQQNIHLPGTAFRVTCVQVNDGSDVSSM
jgi:hypothetical protein